MMSMVGYVSQVHYTTFQIFQNGAKSRVVYALTDSKAMRGQDVFVFAGSATANLATKEVSNNTAT